MPDGNGDRPQWWITISSEDLVKIQIATSEGCLPEVAQGLLSRAVDYIQRQLQVRDLLEALARRPRIVGPR